MAVLILSSKIVTYTVLYPELTSSKIVTFAVIFPLTLGSVQSTGHAGTLGVSISESASLSGVSSAGAVGTLVPNVEANISGVSSSAVVNAVSTLVINGFPIFGVQSNGAVGSLMADGEPVITGIISTTHIGTLGLHIDTNPAIIGVAAIGETGTLVPRIYVGIIGVQSTGAVGTLIPRFNAGTLAMTDLECLTIPGQAVDTTVSMRWSDTRGASWGNPLTKQLATGNYVQNLSYRRLGMGRDRVFEIEFAINGPTALTGIYIEVEEAAT